MDYRIKIKIFDDCVFQINEIFKAILPIKIPPNFPERISQKYMVGLFQNSEALNFE